MQDFEDKMAAYMSSNDSSWLNELLKEISNAADDLEKRVADPLPHEVEMPVRYAIGYNKISSEDG